VYRKYKQTRRNEAPPWWKEKNESSQPPPPPGCCRFGRDNPQRTRRGCQLPEDLREAIVLCEWEKRSVAKAAAILAATPGAVESRLYRARRILRQRLKMWLC
jgi:DNA-directed RNA polymerase specialized sigma24 family protein